MPDNGAMTDRRGVPDLSTFTASAEDYYALHLEAVREPDFTKRVTASWGLIARGSASVPHLLRMLTSSEPDSREDAAGALAWLGSDKGSVVTELLEALEHEDDQQARDSIVIALGALRNRAAIPALAALVRDSGLDGDTRRTAVESLGRIVRRRFDRQADPEGAAIAWLDAHP